MLCVYICLQWQRCVGIDCLRKHPRGVLNIAHRGSSGVLPEHTLQAYEQAVQDGADLIECDLALTRDLKLVCRHESLLNYTTDVALKPAFANKLTTRVVNGQTLTGWFTVDFTLREIKQLRAVQRFQFRNLQYDGQLEIATFEEFIAVAKKHGVGIYPELKDVAWVNGLGLLPEGSRFEDVVLEQLIKHGYGTEAVEKSCCCILQSFEEQALAYLRNNTNLPLAMLFKTNRTEEDLLRYKRHGFYGVGVRKDLITYSDTMGTKSKIAGNTELIQWCHELDLKVHVFTFRNEDRFLLWDYHQDPYVEYKHFLDLEVDGMFTDFPASLNRFLMYEYNAHISTSVGLGSTNNVVIILIILLPTLYVVLT